MNTKETPEEVGGRVGYAIAKDVITNGWPREWTGLDPQDGDQFTAAGLEPESAEWLAAEETAKKAYLFFVGKSKEMA